MIKLQELEGYLENSDRVRIYQDGKEIFTGFWWFFRHGSLYPNARGNDVIRMRATEEVRHRNWKEKGLDRPLQPDETPDYYFRDLQIKLYYKIYITDAAQPCTA